MIKIFTIVAVLYLFGYWLLLSLERFQVDPMREMNQRSVRTLDQLVQTKYFRIIRLNINQECPIDFFLKMCKSKSCSVCRCSEDDIPFFWSSTDRVRTHVQEGQQLWGAQRNGRSNGWVWHVQDMANDEGEYFDIYTNIQSFTNYNGSYIWQLIYEQNCFKPTFQQELCDEEQVLYAIISGLHTSISTHLSRFYKDTHEHQIWAELKNNMAEQFRFNHSEYRKRVLQHPQRIKNLFFIYRILAKAIKEAAPYLRDNFTLTSGNLTEDSRAMHYMYQLLDELESYDLTPKQKQTLKFFTPDNPKVHEYQRYIHNISNILNCVECQKCRLFGKMQTYGVGTALKILLGYPTPYKRNEIVALFNVFNKITMSIDTYYRNRVEEVKLGFQIPDPYYIAFYYCFGGVVLLALLVCCLCGEKEHEHELSHECSHGEEKQD